MMAPTGNRVQTPRVGGCGHRPGVLVSTGATVGTQNTVDVETTNDEPMLDTLDGNRGGLARITSREGADTVDCPTEAAHPSRDCTTRSRQTGVRPDGNRTRGCLAVVTGDVPF